MRKAYILVLVLVLTLVSAACGSVQNAGGNGTKPETAGESTNSEKQQKAIEMVWAGWSGEEESSKEVIQGMIDDWNQDHPQSTVRWIGWPWGKTLEQLTIRTQGGEALDVAQIDMSWLNALAEMDVLVDLNELLGKEWLNQNLESAGLKVGQIDGKQLGVPWTVASIGMTYNPSLLQNAGVKEVPQTIETFEKALQQLKESDPNIIPYAMTTKGAGSVSKDFQAWLWTFGGKVFDDNGNVTINNEAGVETLTWLKHLADQGYIEMDMDRFNARQMYAKKQVGFYDDAIFAKGIAQSNGIAEAELDDQIQPMLRPVLQEGDQPQSIMWGHLLVVFKSSEHKEKAAEFIKHVIGKEQSLAYFETVGLPPVMKEAIASDAVKEDQWVSDWLTITQTGKKSETLDYSNGSQLDKIITEELQFALLGQKTPQQALDDAAKRITNALE